MVQTNSLKSWLLASRPKTLTGAAAPILVALSASYNIYEIIDWPAALLCLAFALLMQIDANFINDYFDCIKGVDNEFRLGPKRACSQGWISLRAMRWGIGIITMLACITGLPLIAWGGMECIIVGISCVLFCFLYTTLFSRIAMGDVLVLLFFGIVPIAYTFYFQTPLNTISDIPQGVWLLALAQGLVTDCLLLVNNFRDRDTDAQVGKTTLVTIIGTRNTLILYLLIGFSATAMACYGIADISTHNRLTNYIPIVFIPIHVHVFMQMLKIKHGCKLNKVLGMTALSIFIFAILVSLALIIG